MKRKRSKKKAGGSANTTHNKSNNTAILVTCPREINGAQDCLCAWPIGGGIIRIQTRVPVIAEAISRLKQTWPVGSAVQGAYLRLFHTTQRPRKIRRTLGRILSRIFPQGRNHTDSVERAEKAKEYQDSRKADGELLPH